MFLKLKINLLELILREQMICKKMLDDKSLKQYFVLEEGMELLGLLIRLILVSF